MIRVIRGIAENQIERRRFGRIARSIEYRRHVLEPVQLRSPCGALDGPRVRIDGDDRHAVGARGSRKGDCAEWKAMASLGVRYGFWIPDPPEL